MIGPARRIVAALLGLLLVALAIPALAAPPIPPAPDQWVTDRAGVLAPATQQALNQRLAAYEQQTGHQLIVWIGERSGAVPIESFAVEAFEQWKIGRAKLDDGLAVFVMVEDRAIRVEVGYGLEPVVTDLIASQVIRNVMIPPIQAGDWDRAIVAGVEALVDAIEGRQGALAGEQPAVEQQPVVETPEQRTRRIAKIVGIAILAVGFLILLIVNPRLALMLLFFAGRGGGGGGGGGFGGGGGRSGGGGATGRW